MTLSVECLAAGATYYFALQSYTEPHANNPRRVESDLGENLAVTVTGTLGDLDGDGAASGTDLTLLASYLAGNLAALPICPEDGDLDGDFEIRPAALAQLLQRLAP